MNPRSGGERPGRSRGLLFAVWLACVGGGVTCASFFFAGRLRDTQIGQAEIPNPGIGGLLNYVMIIPAAGLLLLSLGPALALALRGGGRVPVWVSGLLLSALAVLFII